MTNAELIKALRNCGSTTGDCGLCLYKNHPICHFQMMIDAADALEAVDIEIADCIAAIDALDDSNDAYIKENERLKKRIAELEAQSQKEDKWMTNIRWDYQQPSQSATRNVGTHFLCRSTGKLCPNATEYGYCKQTVCTMD